MSKNNNPQSDGMITYTGIGMAIGLVFGGLVGALVGNLIIFAGGGMILGFAAGAALNKRT